MNTTMNKMVLGALLMISTSVMAQIPTEPGQNVKPDARHACRVQLTNDAMIEMAMAVGTWKNLDLDSEEGQKAYATNSAILVAIQNPKSTVNQLIRSYCDSQSRSN
jgi:hypothetical protein